MTVKRLFLSETLIAAATLMMGGLGLAKTDSPQMTAAQIDKLVEAKLVEQKL
jgi:hypothetical protein